MTKTLDKHIPTSHNKNMGKLRGQERIVIWGFSKAEKAMIFKAADLQYPDWPLPAMSHFCRILLLAEAKRIVDEAK